MVEPGVALVLLEGAAVALTRLSDRRPQDVDAILNALEELLRVIGPVPLGGVGLRPVFRLAA